jgi:hypothetical protein
VSLPGVRAVWTALVVAQGRLSLLGCGRCTLSRFLLPSGVVAIPGIG